ncbi:hypothetical protein EVAR_49816_1 [Eumeta japonica]|uniref:Uncharacterized protein n=1 Tax=Eumeta variegata TaxID=151549 RepID=A0A4C1XPB7_EUMVA|nr:hypothetical protein EVAR_49816_1 [Eumeta japonica]
MPNAPKEVLTSKYSEVKNPPGDCHAVGIRLRNIKLLSARRLPPSSKKCTGNAVAAGRGMTLILLRLLCLRKRFRQRLQARARVIGSRPHVTNLNSASGSSTRSAPEDHVKPSARKAVGDDVYNNPRPALRRRALKMQNPYFETRKGYGRLLALDIVTAIAATVASSAASDLRWTDVEVLKSKSLNLKEEYCEKTCCSSEVIKTDKTTAVSVCMLLH